VVVAALATLVAAIDACACLEARAPRKSRARETHKIATTRPLLLQHHVVRH
jgi:hypothetical protein